MKKSILAVAVAAMVAIGGGSSNAVAGDAKIGARDSSPILLAAAKKDAKQTSKKKVVAKKKGEKPKAKH